LLITLGGGSLELKQLEGDPVVVPFAPQLELLKRATMTVSHGGLNTAMESLANAVPIVAIPIANDQHGVAARVQWHRVGERLILRHATAERLREALERVLYEPSYRENAMRMQAAIERTGGIPAAVEIIERAMLTQQPVSRLSLVRSYVPA
jgi:UDP:flavonoid glycosyltransferase YjiC (YdhE family)